MEILDLLYAKLKTEYDGTVIGSKPVVVSYVYDQRVVDVNNAHWILLYQTTETVKWFDIGAGNWVKDEVVSLDVRTQTKEAYGKIKDYLYSIFDGEQYTFKEKTSFDAEFTTNKERVGMNLCKVNVADTSTYNIGDYVSIDDGVEVVTGWICGIKENEYVFVHTVGGNYILIRPRSFIELSDKMKLLFRFVMDVEASCIIPI